MNKLILLGFLLLPLVSCSEYHQNNGMVFGTSYHISYAYKSGKDLHPEITENLALFNASLSTYDPKSVISRVNSNDPNVRVDSYFEKCLVRANEISSHTQGAFDMTVAPLVNAWGFGFEKEEHVSPELIDSLRQFCGYTKISIDQDKVVKEAPGVMLDASAIAKGYGVDVVAELLESKGISNYLVEIGGELRCKGKNSKGLNWRVGIDKPIENLLEREIEAVLALSDISMATSGNYRQFYVKDGVKYSHTIDPKTGYPVRHSLLSATVLMQDCMSADAYATAFMVMGIDAAKKLVEETPAMEAFFIFAAENGELATWSSPGALSFLD